MTGPTPHGGRLLPRQAEDSLHVQVKDGLPANQLGYPVQVVAMPGRFRGPGIGRVGEGPAYPTEREGEGCKGLNPLMCQDSPDHGHGLGTPQACSWTEGTIRIAEQQALLNGSGHVTGKPLVDVRRVGEIRFGL